MTFLYKKINLTIIEDFQGMYAGLPFQIQISDALKIIQSLKTQSECYNYSIFSFHNCLKICFADSTYPGQ